MYKYIEIQTNHYTAPITLASDTEISHIHIVAAQRVFLVHVSEDDFSPWSTWSSCSATCDEGSQFRTRSCNGAITSGIRSCIQQKCRSVEGEDCHFLLAWMLLNQISLWALLFV